MTDGTTGGQLHAEWDRVCGRMRTEIGEAAYRSWVAPMTVRGVHDGLARISVPTRFMRDWIVAHYADRLQSLCPLGDSNVAISGDCAAHLPDGAVRSIGHRVLKGFTEETEVFVPG